MVFAIIAIVQMFILEVLMVRTMYVLLAPRFPRLFVASILLVWAIRMVTQILGINRGVLVVVLLILHTFALPLLLSSRSWPRRAMGLAAAMAAMTIVELVAEGLYRFISGGAVFPTEYSLQNYSSFYWIYTVMIAVGAPIFELIISFFRNADNDWDMSLEWPVTAFLFIAVAATWYWSTRSNLLGRVRETSALVTLVLIAVQQMIAIVLVTVARNDARAQREAARQQVLMRQSRHLSLMVEESAARVMGMRRLRHDLANQVDVVRSLAAQGRHSEADHHLGELQEAAHELAGGFDEQAA